MHMPTIETSVFNYPVQPARPTGYTPFVRTLAHEGDAIDVVGDVHGCMNELMVLLARAGYQIADFTPGGTDPIAIRHPEGRRLVLLGDLTDRGPYSDQVLRLAMGLRMSGAGDVIMGNHDWKLYRYLIGRKIQMAKGLASTLDQILPLGSDFLEAIIAFYEDTPHQIRIDHAPEGGRTWLAHGSCATAHQGQADANSFTHSIYGYPTERTTKDGYLEREDWAASYTGTDRVIHGHEKMRRPVHKNGVLNIDTGCVFNNALTLYRLDSDAFLQEAAHAPYREWHGYEGQGPDV